MQGDEEKAFQFCCGFTEEPVTQFLFLTQRLFSDVRCMQYSIIQMSIYLPASFGRAGRCGVSLESRAVGSNSELYNGTITTQTGVHLLISLITIEKKDGQY
jgi:hypothetical protein